MKKLSSLLMTLCAVFIMANLHAGPPTPPAGYKWVQVSALTDEFNDGSVNGNKWLKYNPYWIGRAPGLFKPAQVTEGGGTLKLKNKKVAATSADRWVHTGFLASKSKTAFYAGMYSECRLKCASDGTVTGFWMSKPQAGTKQEIDVQEGVGWSPNGNQNLTKLMRMNTHSASGATQGANYGIGAGVGNQYFTYGVWWKDKRNINMYLGNKKVASIYTKGDFTGGMQLNINTETQNWLGDPNVSFLGNNSRNTTYVDYVRTWKLVKSTDAGGGSTSQKIALKNVGNNKYISSENGTNSMNCNRSSLGGWEKFTIIDLGGGKHALKGSNGKYVSSENGNKKMFCNRSSIGGWEKFTFEHKGNQVYALKGSNGKYVGSDMWCNNSSNGNYERFKITWGLKNAEVVLSQKSDLNVYPNPASDILMVNGLEDRANTLKIFNVQGKVIKSADTEAIDGFTNLNIADLSKGIYILRIENSKQIQTLRFVKQ